MTNPEADRVFISYETINGLTLARLAKMTLRDRGLLGWVWHDDSKVGAYVHDEIAARIQDHQHFLCLCTQETQDSDGQAFERKIALWLKKLPIIIAFDKDHIPLALVGSHELRTTIANFPRDCDAAADEIARRNGISLPVATEIAAQEQLDGGAK